MKENVVDNNVVVMVVKTVWLINLKEIKLLWRLFISIKTNINKNYQEIKVKVVVVKKVNVNLTIVNVLWKVDHVVSNVIVKNVGMEKNKINKIA